MTSGQKISYDRLDKIVRQFRGRRIAVVGDWMLDRYIWGTASRLSPEAAVPVVEYTKQTACLGGAGNVAANLSALGARVTSFGVAGNDEAGSVLRECLRGLKMAEKGIIVDRGRPTTLKMRIIARHQQVVRVDTESRQALDVATEKKLASAVVASLRNADGVVISDYDKGVVTDGLVVAVMSECERRKIPAFVKPKWSRLPTYRGAMVIVCNRAEAGFLVTRTLEDDDSIEEAGRALLAHFDCAAVVITRGERGMSVFERGSLGGFHIAATSREQPIGEHGANQMAQGRQVFDVTGAGDTVLATLALAMATGAGIGEAAVLGNAAAGVVVSKLGTATLTPAELSAALRDLLPQSDRGRSK